MTAARSCLACGALAVALTVAPAVTPAGAWTRESQVAIAETAAKLAPLDLTRQIERHRKSLRDGVLGPFADHLGDRHEVNPDGSGRLVAVLGAEARRAIAGIEGHRPFSEIVHQLGVVSHFVADLNDPLQVANRDPRERGYAADYPRYLDAARGRFPVIYYGSGRRVDSAEEMAALLSRALERGRRLYSDVGREYRRVGGVRSEGFDDRSTAFAVGSLAYSHAVSDVAAVLRYIWLAAGGSDQGALPTVAGDRLVLLGRGTAGR